MGTEAIKALAGRLSDSSLTARRDNAPIHRYPAKIRLSDSAEAYIAGLAVDLALAEIELHQLPAALLEFWSFAYENGRGSRQTELDRANADADRYYAEMCRRPAPRYAETPSYADLERIRGNHEHADEVDAANARRFAEVSR